MDATLELRQALLDIADRHRETVFAAHTHTQPRAADDDRALPARRDRAARARRRAAAGGLRADQPVPARVLRDHRHGISDRPRSSPRICSASTARPATPTAASRRSTTCSRACRAAAVLVAGLGRFVQDLLLWCTSEFNYLRLGDGFVQVSSIMPQKRNPVALEHARAIAQQGAWAGAGGRHQRAQHAIRRHRRHRGRSAAARRRGVSRCDAGDRLVAAALASAEFDTERLEASAAEGWTTLTELADTLVREPESAVQRGARDHRPADGRQRARAAAALSAELLERGVARSAGSAIWPTPTIA